jgi:glucan-binding YG repeat protein
LIILTCALAGTVGWIVYDMNVDRSGFLLEDGIYYYRDFHARLVTGWQNIDGHYYYFGEDHAMATYWQDINGNRYYFSGDGTMDTGWVLHEEEYYYMGADGIMLNEKPTTSAKQGDYISLKVVSEVRRGDKVYKEVPRA